MSGAPVSTGSHPPHGHPDNTSPSHQGADKPSTASHPPSTQPDPTIDGDTNGPPRRLSQSSTSSASTQLAGLKAKLRGALKQYPDFPKQGILFEDILPIFADPQLHEALVDAFELQIKSAFGENNKPDVIVGLEARGFLFGPSLALRIGAGFVPVRKEGKMPGEVVTASYKKEYGEDHFQMQKGAVKPGAKVLVVDDLIATGRSSCNCHPCYR